MNESTNYKKLLEKSFFTIKDLRIQLEAQRTSQHEPIAVVGMGCRFPGGAHDPNAYWELLRDGVDAICEVPEGRWGEKAYASYLTNDIETTSKGANRWGGFLQQPVADFDAAFFGITPREANSMDPQQRLVLEVAWEALENAGQPVEQLAGSPTGVFMGVSGTDYALLEASTHVNLDAYVSTGNTHSVLAGRLSYLLDLRGPCIALDTACSSSLVAVHLACQSLRNGESNLALAGGVNLILSPLSSMALSYWGMLAEDGRCKTFDAGANGYVRGEGCGILVLKRLSDAQKAGDTVLAVIRGSAVKQDGRSAGLTAPNPLAQEEVIRQASRDAGIDPAHLSYIEAHGTGTPLGDPIEMDALKAVIATKQQTTPVCHIGSVKTNLGHLEAAAGVAGLIKVILALQHKEIPPHLHLKQLNPNITLEQTPFKIPQQLIAWQPIVDHRYAGVSSFGFGGTIAHIILDEVPATPPVEKASIPQNHDYILPLSAQSVQSLRATAQNYRDTLLVTEDRLAEICATASLRRNHLTNRLAVIGKNRQEIADALTTFLQEGEQSNVLQGQKKSIANKVVFIFPGQGSQWVGMANSLLQHEPVFTQALLDCEQAMRPHVDWSLRTLLTEASHDLAQRQRLFEDISVLQPALFAIEFALAALWRSWGIHPDAVVGHSMGEVAAAACAGILSLEQAAQLICQRSRLLKRVSGQGAMLFVELSVAQLEAQLTPDQRRHCAIAISNSTRSTVLSGDPTILESLAQQWQAQGLFCRWIKVDVASHSPQMDPLLPDLQTLLQNLEPQPAQSAFFSTVSAQWEDGTACDATYWVNNLRQPVRFAQSIQQLIQEGYRTFVEVSPHPILLPAIEENLDFLEVKGQVYTSLKRNEPEQAQLLRSLAGLYVGGQNVRWSAFYPQEYTPVDLPTYPWQRSHFWFNEVEAGITSNTHFGSVGISQYPTHHPLLGQGLNTPIKGKLFEVQLRADQPVYIEEHRVFRKIALAATAYIEMALAALYQVNLNTPDGPYILENTSFLAPLFFKQNQARSLQTILSFEDEEKRQRANWQIFSLDELETGEQLRWKKHAQGEISCTTTLPSVRQTQSSTLIEAQSQCQQVLSADYYYQQLQDQGITYGPHIRALQQLWTGEQRALGLIQLDKQLESGINDYLMHPIVFDACLQLLGVCLLKRGNTELPQERYAPVRIQSITFYRSLPERCWGHAVLHTAETAEAPETGDITIFNEAGELIIEVKGLQIEKVYFAPQTTLTAEESKEDEELIAIGRSRELRDQLSASKSEKRQHILTPRVQYIIARIAGIAEATDLDPDKSVFEFGIDSITAIEVKNALSKLLDCSLPTTLLFDHTTIHELVSNLLYRLELSSNASSTPDQPVANTSNATR